MQKNYTSSKSLSQVTSRKDMLAKLFGQRALLQILAALSAETATLWTCRIGRCLVIHKPAKQQEQQGIGICGRLREIAGVCGVFAAVLLVNLVVRIAFPGQRSDECRPIASHSYSGQWTEVNCSLPKLYGFPSPSVGGKVCELECFPQITVRGCPR